MGVNDYGTAAQTTAAPSLADWAADVAAVVDGSDVTVDTRIATHNADTTAVHGIADTALLETVGHASKHAAAGSDPVTLAQSQVTNLVADLAAKAPLASPTLTGTVTVPTPAAGSETTVAASTAWAAERAKVGNLLTANQASVETDTTGFSAIWNCTIAASTDQAFHGNRSLKVTVSATTNDLEVRLADTAVGTVTPGAVYQFYGRVRSAQASPRLIAVAIAWYTSGGSVISTVYNNASANASSAGWSELFGTPLVAPATASYARVRLYTSGAFTAGDVYYFDTLGLWAGAGGEWAMPGTPITNLGTKVSHPNVDDVLVQRWDSSKATPGWQTVWYDSGVRDVSSLLLNGWVKRTNEFVTLRRIGNMGLLSVALNGAAATNTKIMDMPSGFKAGTTSGRHVAAIDDGYGVAKASYYWQNALGSSGVYCPIQSLAFASYVWTVSDAIPTSLPGTLVSAAPA